MALSSFLVSVSASLAEWVFTAGTSLLADRASELKEAMIPLGRAPLLEHVRMGMGSGGSGNNGGPAPGPDRGTAPAERGLSDLRLTPELREILNLPVTSLGYVLEDQTTEFRGKLKRDHSVICNGTIRRVLIDIPKEFLSTAEDKLETNLEKMSGLARSFYEKYPDTTLYVFSGTLDYIPPVFEDQVFKLSWKRAYGIEGRFIPWNWAKELEKKIESREWAELFFEMDNGLNLKPISYPDLNLTKEQRSQLILLLSRHDKLGYLGEERKHFLLDAGIEEDFIGTLPLGVVGQREYASRLFYALIKARQALSLLLHYIDDHDEEISGPDKDLITLLITEYHL
jgi:hypothetical protein